VFLGSDSPTIQARLKPGSINSGESSFTFPTALSTFHGHLVGIELVANSQRTRLF
jgi:hypothetical protein